jgi:MFS family permease
MNTAIVRRNLRLLIGILCLTPTYVLVPIFVVFFQTRGLNQTGVFLTQAVFAAIVVAVELPSGWFADRFGYKHSLIIGTVVVTLSYAAYIPDLGLTSILIAEALCGLGFGFMSGADSSLAYGSLAAIGETDALSERYGTNRQVWSNVTGVILGTAGGLLTLVDIYLAVIVQVLVTFITIPLALLLHEPPHMKPNQTGQTTLKMHCKI